MKKTIFTIKAMAAAAAIVITPISYAYSGQSPDTVLAADDGSQESLSTVKYRVKADMLNVRCGPDTSYPVIGTLAKKQTIQVRTISSGWAEFKFQGCTAYVSTRYLSKKK